MKQQKPGAEMIPTSEISEILVADQSTDGEEDNAKQEMKKTIDATEFGASERKQFVDKLLRHVEDDNLRLLHKIRERLDRVNVKLPTIEVRYKNLCVEAECEVVHGKPLPTLWNTAKGMLSGCSRVPGLSHRAKVHMLKDISGTVKPSRMTLLLGPPGSGKTTMLRALAGRLDKPMKVTGEVDYNGFRLDEFVPQKTSTYVSQQNLHVAEMTLRETLDFSARFQGVGGKEDLFKEVIRREKEAGITPDIGVDTYMKATWLEGLEATLQTDYVMKIMGLDSCANTMVGDAMRRGISGGEKKRLTTAEMIVGPSRALFMDEISTGLDSTTTFRVVSFLQQLAHIMEYTVMVSLLQPAQETYELFDDVILIDEGKIIYHGPRSHTLDFFQECGFKCPERKGTADFLQEVLSKNDQEQYWNRPVECYNYVTAHEFSKKFKSYHIGQCLANELSKLYDKSICNKDALSFKMYSLPRLKIFGACFARELLLLRRNLFTYVFKSTQIGVLAIITGTIFLGTDLKLDILHANHIMGSISYTLILQLVSAFSELALTTARLPVFYKQRDLHFYPAWAYAIPPAMIRILISLIESIIWTSITYSLIGYSPEKSRFFCQLITITLLNATSSSVFRFVASYFQTHVAAALSSSSATLLFLIFGGFILPRSILTSWSRWGFWLSPVAYAEIGLATNEFLAPRWQKKLPSNTTIGRQALKEHGLDYNGYYYWISTGALVGYMILCNIGFSLALTFKRPVGASRLTISHEEFLVLQKRDLNKQLDSTNKINYSSRASATNHTRRRMALPFIPLAMSFEDVNYYVDTPQKRLQLLQKISGSLRPGILSALMGVTGAGKTTLLDVLSGRKTGGITEGDIRIEGFPRVQATFARVSAYCEQTDIHSPQVTVEESLIYSAWLRLPPEIDPKTRNEFVNEVLETIELDGIRDALVGRPGVDGLSIEQRKRLTVAVELVSNPSIIFMDEPTSGLDARAAAVVLRAVKSIAETGRTIVCTIHQPSIDIFEAFDEVILMKKGGELIYNGPLGRNSCKVIEYFQQVSGVPRIKANYNPATWMMEVTSTSVETQLEIDFAKIYQESPLHRDNLMLIKQLNKPHPGSTALSFPTPYARNGWGQFKACLWKQYLSYWRSPSYNLTRIMYMFLASIMYGVLYWGHGNNISTQQDLFTTLGCMFAITLGTGINNSKSVMPFIAMERTVVYRETFAGMYSSWAYSFAQVAVEIPFVLLQVALFMFIAYPAIGFSWTAYKFCWFFYTLFVTILYFVYFGMLLTSVTPNVHMAAILSSVFFTLQNLFSGYIVPMQRIPKWWIWFYYMSPLAWTLNGLFTSQFGDVESEIAVFGENKTVASFLGDYFGFYHNHLPMVAVVLLAFPLIFASLFAYFIRKLNFQRR